MSTPLCDLGETTCRELVEFYLTFCSPLEYNLGEV